MALFNRLIQYIDKNRLIAEGESVSHYIRRYAAGGTCFFTVVTYERRPLFAAKRARRCLRDVLFDVQAQLPFELVATVLLPEPWHCVWALPDNDFDHSKR